MVDDDGVPRPNVLLVENLGIMVQGWGCGPLRWCDVRQLLCYEWGLSHSEAMVRLGL